MDPHVKHFITLVESWNAAGWGEYLLFEVVEGKRVKPFKFLPPLSAADLDVLRRLRDELKIWPFFDPSTGQWDTVSIGLWRLNMAETSADDIRDGMVR